LRRQGQPAAARPVAQQALELARASSDLRSEAQARVLLGEAYIQLGDPLAGEEQLREALGQARHLQDGRLTYMALAYMGRAAEAQGAPGRAIELYEEGLSLIEQVGDPTLQTVVLRDIAGAAIDVGQLGYARRRLTESLSLSPNIREVAPALAKAARLAAVEGKAERAVRLAGAAMTLREPIHSRLQRTDEVQLEKRLATAREVLGTEAAAAALANGQAMSLEVALAYVLEDLN